MSHDGCKCVHIRQCTRAYVTTIKYISTLTLKIKGNHKCIYLIYSVIMATGSHVSHCCGNMPGYISGTFNFWLIACMTSSLYYIQFNKCICNLTSEYSFNCGFKIFFDLSDMVYTQVVYITYNMGSRDLPDIYAHALGLGYIYISGKSLLPML